MGKPFCFNELSEGQRCLIGRCTSLHFVLAQGGTAVIDETDNSLALREIQPWQMAASDAIEESGGQFILISHHPEIINQWAPGGGVDSVRDDAGPVRAEPFEARSYYYSDSCRDRGEGLAAWVSRPWQSRQRRAVGPQT